MKTLYIAYTLMLITFFALSETVQAQQSQQKIEMTIDELGNAKINMGMTMNAQQWQVWSTTLGNNPAAVKREAERAMPAYFLDNFELEKDEMNRSFTLSLNAYGVCEIDKRGNWTLDVDQENAQLIELTETKYMFSSSPSEFGGQVQQNYTINLPENAKNIKVSQNAFGNDVFKFKMDAPRAMKAGFSVILRWGGLVLLIIGIGLGIKNIFLRNRAVV